MSTDAYAGLARLYDPGTALFLDPGRRLLRDVLAGLGARRVLDVCCGTGRLVALLRAAGFAASGIDASPAMLVRARKRALPVTRMDARAMAFADARFDATCICLALHENALADRLAILAEMGRVTRPGGHVLVFDYAPSPRPSFLSGLVGLIELSAGRIHYRNFRDFQARKGGAGLLYQAGRAVATAYPCLGGQACLLVSPNAPRPLPGATA